MSELTDDQLDGLFRKSAEEFDPPFDSAAWRDMKTRLDANDRTTEGAWLWKNLLRWGLPVLLLLLAGGAWYTYRKVYPTTNKSVSTVSTKSKQTTGQRAKIATPDATRELIRTATKVGLKEDAMQEQPTNEPALVAESPVAENRLNKSVEPVISTGKKSGSAPIAATKRSTPTYGDLNINSRLHGTRLSKSTNTIRRNIVGAKRYRPEKRSFSPDRLDRRQRKAISKQYATALTTVDYAKTSKPALTKKQRLNRQKSASDNRINSTDILGSIPASQTEAVVVLTPSELAIRPAKWPKPLAFSDRAVTARPDTTARSVTPKVPSEKGLSIRFMVAPDLSTIGLKNFSRPGTNIGLLLEYRLAPRWSVQAGVIQSTKVYRALSDEYKAQPGTWGGYLKASNVDGRCDMIDIPINLRYDVIVRPRKDGRSVSRWFVSGGVTSYIMEKEYYRYNYPYQPHGNQRSDTTTNTGSYGFSNLNLSVGYEGAISKRLSWQIEPFMKIPIRSVGYFGINLISTGAFFSIRYKLK